MSSRPAGQLSLSLFRYDAMGPKICVECNRAVIRYDDGHLGLSTNLEPICESTSRYLWFWTWYVHFGECFFSHRRSAAGIASMYTLYWYAASLLMVAHQLRFERCFSQLRIRRKDVLICFHSELNGKTSSASSSHSVNPSRGVSGSDTGGMLDRHW